VAAWVGIFVFVIVMLVYLPITVRNLSDIGNGLNYLVDMDTLAFSGTALLLASALPVENYSVAALADPREPAVRAGALVR